MGTARAMLGGSPEGRLFKSKSNEGRVSGLSASLSVGGTRGVLGGASKR